MEHNEKILKIIFNKYLNLIKYLVCHDELSSKNWMEETISAAEFNQLAMFLNKTSKQFTISKCKTDENELEVEIAATHLSSVFESFSVKIDIVFETLAPEVQLLLIQKIPCWQEQVKEFVIAITHLIFILWDLFEVSIWKEGDSVYVSNEISGFVPRNVIKSLDDVFELRKRYG